MAAQPRTEWFRQVAGRLLVRSPLMTPLEAMRRAMDAFPTAEHDDPEVVAEALIHADALRSDRSPPAA